MQCPNCRGENPNGSTNCYYCGAPLMNQPYGQQPYGQPYGQQPYGAPQGNSALRSFGKSPMIMIAAIAFTVVAVLNIINMFDTFDALEYYFDALEDYPLQAIGLIAAFFLPVAYALIAGGLWKLYVSDGSNESSLACTGFTTFAVLTAIGTGAPLLEALFEDSEAFFELFGEYLLVPTAICVVAVVAALNAKNLVAGIGRAAAGGNANANEAGNAGIWCIVYGSLTMLTFLGVFEEMGMGNPSDYLEGTDLLSYLSNVAGFVVLGVAGMNFKNLLSGRR